MTNLVIGADSFLGAKVIQVLAEEGKPVIGSTRRKSTLSRDRVFLDLGADNVCFQVPEGITYAYPLAGVWNYGECESDPAAWKTNVTNMALLAAQLLEQDVFVTFVSSNTVFGGERPWCHEDDPHFPSFTYARHKSAGESAIKAAAEHLGKSEHLNIVRLTKILDIDTPPVPDWLASMRCGKAITPFSDFIFAPISLRYAAEALVKIGCQRVSGNLHISGARNVGYDEFARKLVEAFGFQSIPIVPVTSVEKNVSIPFMPHFSGIGMERTTKLTGIKPQLLEDVIDDLIAEYSLLEKNRASKGHDIEP